MAHNAQLTAHFTGALILASSAALSQQHQFIELQFQQSN
jgi:hypothetical protein